MIAIAERTVLFPRSRAILIAEPSLFILLRAPVRRPGLSFPLEGKL
jgi:hypothetical protein